MDEKEKEIHEKHTTIKLKQMLKYDFDEINAYNKGIKHATNHISELIGMNQLNGLSEMTDEDFQDFLRKQMDDFNS